MISKHYLTDRKRRQDVINMIGNGNVVDEFFWDKGHPNGPEIHKVTSTGIIKIYNAISGKFVTSLIARPQQIRRYYEFENKKAPKYLIDIAVEHQRMGYNNI